VRSYVAWEPGRKTVVKGEYAFLLVLLVKNAKGY
jgi:hypothetical protein